MNILLVDDDEISRLVLASLLRRMPGVGEVMEAIDGEDAWGKLQDGFRPVLCCCDLMMPNLDGVGLLLRARADLRFSELPFVMISSAADRQSVSQAAQAGADGFIAKPYSSTVVTRAVAKVLRESLENVEEPAVDTRRRLGISQQELISHTQRLREKVDESAAEFETEKEVSARATALQRLSSSCATLGMLRCSRLLERGSTAATEQIALGLLLLEVAKMLDTRLLALK
ncbi:MAG: response regulator [Comamonadaceae bacterium]|nr:MAG: response regulator [Comamonadaceae bacterium]